MSEIYIQSIIHNLKKLEIEKEKLNKEIKEHENELKKYMQMYGLEELHGMGGEKAIFKEVLSRRFDVKEFKKHFESLYYSYMKSTSNYRFKFSY